MITVQTLKDFGANVEDGVKRCAGREDLYLRLVPKATENKSFDDLAACIKAGDLDGAFEAAHALKGVLSNLSLTALTEPVSEITELLRARTQADYSPIVEVILKKRDELKALCSDA